MTERYGTLYLGGLECGHEELAAKLVPFSIVHTKSYKIVNQDDDDSTEYYAPSHYQLVAMALQDQVLSKYHPQLIITDTSPLRHLRQWQEVIEMTTTTATPPIVPPIWQVSESLLIPTMSCQH
jgi:hypothetical protein